MNTLRATCAVLALAVIAACSSVESDWQQATAANTVAAYQQFLQQHPSGPHADEARTRLNQLQDEQAWTTAQSANTTDAYQQYLQSQPNGAHVQEAHDRMTGLARAAAWTAAQSAGTAAALQQFLQQYPTGPEADQARAQLDKLNSYLVELGSFGSAHAAEQASAKLQQRYGAVVHTVQVQSPSGTGKTYRVVSAPMTEDDATAACATLKKSHQHCQVVKRPDAAG